MKIIHSGGIVNMKHNCVMQGGSLKKKIVHEHIPNNPTFGLKKNSHTVPIDGSFLGSSLLNVKFKTKKSNIKFII